MAIKMRKKRVMALIIGIILILAGIFSILFFIAQSKAISRFRTYQNKALSIETSFGTMCYIDEGEGEPILSCHGICGGYDQAYDTLSDKIDKYRIIAPARFGYTGTDAPENPTVEMQADAFVELLDSLNIDKAYILATSAGGASAIKFALKYPERTKGLILYCSGYPATEPLEESEYIMGGPPSAVCHDFIMWAISPLFGPIMGMDSGAISTIMPLSERRDGIAIDSEVTNIDMEVNYQDYDMRNLKVPVLICHSKDDKLADFSKVEYWAKVIPNCTSKIFETGGHLMSGNSEEISGALEKFISENAYID